LYPASAWAALGVVTALIALLATHPALVPSSRLLVWSGHAGLVIAVDAAIGWLLVGLHELGHLATARAAGAPARITLATRLQFLVAQTDVSGVWAAPHRTRMHVYLSGMTVDVGNALAFLVIVAFAHPQGIAGRLLAVASAEALLMIPTQLLVFMRTDLYFLLQDFSHCANLYADAISYLRHVALRVMRKESKDPSLDHPPRQRYSVRWYSALLLAGTAVCLGIEVAVSIPALVTLLVRALAEMTDSVPATVLDGTAALGVLTSWEVLWAARWWHRHGPKVHRYLERR
jgi:hypothetical protein